MEIGKITPAEAAAILHLSVQTVRVSMQRGKLPIGMAIKMSSKWTYNISPKLLAEYSGADVEKELEKIRDKEKVRTGITEIKAATVAPEQCARKKWEEDL